MGEGPADSERRTCLVLLPEREASGDVAVRLEEAILMSDMNVASLDSHGEYGTLLSEIAAQIPRTIESADAVIADMSGSDPNIMYQLGFAHALKKPVLPIIQRDSGSVPSNLQGYLFLVYDTANLSELARAVRRWLIRQTGAR
jgi:nucleoside 2-deoxyribosyltransferase